MMLILNDKATILEAISFAQVCNPARQSYFFFKKQGYS